MLLYIYAADKFMKRGDVQLPLHICITQRGDAKLPMCKHTYNLERGC